jgi:hypothetical protein
VSSSSPEVIPAETSDVGSAEATDVTAAKATDVTAAKAADVTAAKAAADVATTTTKTTTTVAAATAAAAGLCSTGGNEATGKQRTCQNHHQSSSHDISPFEWADIPPQDLQQMSARLSETDADVVMVWRWQFSPAVSIKFSLNNRRIRSKASARRLATGRQTEASVGVLASPRFRNAKFVFS